MTRDRCDDGGMQIIALSILLAIAPPRERPNARRNAGIVLLVVGVVATIVGGSLLGAAYQDESGDGLFRDTCVKGKPCGDTCIELSDTCHIPSGTPMPMRRGEEIGDTVPMGVPISGIALLSVGPVMAFAGWWMIAVDKARKRQVVVTGNGLVVKF